MNSHELLESLRKEVEKTIVTVEQDFEGLPTDVLQYKPSATAWSILECLEHLNKYSAYYNAAIRRAVDKSPKTTSAIEVRSTWLGKKFIGMMHPGNVKAQKTFQRMDPSNTDLDRIVLETFLRNQKELLELINMSRNADLNKGKVPVEFFKLLKMNSGDALQFVIVHQQRHVLQATRVKALTDGHKEPALKI